MKIVISGSSGLLGSALTKGLLADGHNITKLVRPGGPVGAGTIAWNPETGVLDAVAMEGFDAFIHLSGENVADSKWTEENKKKFVDSRVHSTRLLCSRLMQLKNPPRVFIMASAIGYYGSRGDEELTEQGDCGTGFLAELTRQWEKASETLEQTDIRAVRLRIGVVLSPDGGALPRMIKYFKLGLGGRIGDGQQYLSWIGLDDVVGVIKFVLENEKISGPVNVVAPLPATNREFTKALAEVLKRPSIAVIPAFVLRLKYGEMAEETLLSSIRAVPKVLNDAGYIFIDTDLKRALKKYTE